MKIFFPCRNPGDVLETFNFLENADDSDEEEESDMIEDIADGKEKHRINKKHKVKKSLSFIVLLFNPTAQIGSSYYQCQYTASNPTDFGIKLIEPT